MRWTLLAALLWAPSALAAAPTDADVDMAMTACSSTCASKAGLEKLKELEQEQNDAEKLRSGLKKAHMAALAKQPKLSVLKRHLRTTMRERQILACNTYATVESEFTQALHLLDSITSKPRRFPDRRCHETPPTPSDRTVAKRGRGAELSTVVVDLYGNEKPGMGLGRVNQEEPVAGEPVPIQVDTDALFGLSGWAVKPESFSKTTILNPTDDGVNLTPGQNDLYVWTPMDPARTLFVSAMHTADPIPTSKTTITFNLSPAEFAHTPMLTTTTARIPASAIPITHTGGGAGCPNATINRTSLPPTGTNSCSYTYDPGTPVDSATIDISGTKRTAKVKTLHRQHVNLANPPPACTEAPRLTSAALESWSLRKGSGRVMRCGVPPKGGTLAVLRRDGVTQDYPLESAVVDVKTSTIKTLEVHLETSGAPSLVHSQTGDAAKGTVTFGPRLEKGTATLKVRTIADDASANIGLQAIGQVRAAPEPDEVGSIQVHIGLLARDSMRNVVLTGMVTPVWSKRAHRAFLAGQRRWGAALMPKPALGIRLAADSDVSSA